MNDPVEALARKVRDDPFFLAPILEAYAAPESDPDARLLCDLGCDLPELTMLRLCRMPRPEPDGFREDVARIAERFGFDQVNLTRVIRRGEVLLRMRSSGDADGLMAARDLKPEHEGGP